MPHPEFTVSAELVVDVVPSIVVAFCKAERGVVKLHIAEGRRSERVDQLTRPLTRELWIFKSDIHHTLRASIFIVGLRGW